MLYSYRHDIGAVLRATALGGGWGGAGHDDAPKGFEGKTAVEAIHHWTAGSAGV